VSESIKIGQVLIEHGVMSEQQVFEVLQAQKERRSPFGVLAERLFDVTLESIERAWIDQYARFTGSFSIAEQHVDAEALKTINRRQAWQFEMLPLHFDGDGELLIAASRQRLARAVTFAAERLDHAVYFRVAESDELRAFLRQHYPMSEVSQAMIDKAREFAHASAVGDDAA